MTEQKLFLNGMHKQGKKKEKSQASFEFWSWSHLSEAFGINFLELNILLDANICGLTKPCR